MCTCRDWEPFAIWTYRQLLGCLRVERQDKKTGSLHCHQGDLFWTLNDQYPQGFCFCFYMHLWFQGQASWCKLFAKSSWNKGKSVHTKSGAPPLLSWRPLLTWPRRWWRWRLLPRWHIWKSAVILKYHFLTDIISSSCRGSVLHSRCRFPTFIFLSWIVSLF